MQWSPDIKIGRNKNIAPNAFALQTCYSREKRIASALILKRVDNHERI